MDKATMLTGKADRLRAVQRIETVSREINARVEDERMAVPETLALWGTLLSEALHLLRTEV